VGWSPTTVFFETTVVDCSFYFALCKTMVVGWLPTTIFFETTVVGCSFYFTLRKTTVVHCLPPKRLGKILSPNSPDGYKDSTNFCRMQKIVGFLGVGGWVLGIGAVLVVALLRTCPMLTPKNLI